MKPAIKYAAIIVVLTLLAALILNRLYKDQPQTASVYQLCRSTCEMAGFGVSFCRDYCSPFQQFPDGDDEEDQKNIA